MRNFNLMSRARLLSQEHEIWTAQRDGDGTGEGQEVVGGSKSSF